MKNKIEPVSPLVMAATLDSVAAQHGYIPVGHEFRSSDIREAVAAMYQPTAETAAAEICPAYDLLDEFDLVAHRACWAPITREVDNCLDVSVCYASDPREAGVRALVSIMLGLDVG